MHFWNEFYHVVVAVMFKRFQFCITGHKLTRSVDNTCHPSPLQRQDYARPRALPYLHLDYRQLDCSLCSAGIV